MHICHSLWMEDRRTTRGNQLGSVEVPGTELRYSVLVAGVLIY